MATAVNTKTPFKNKPSVLTIYQLPSPLAVDKAVDRQAEIILTQARVVDSNYVSAGGTQLQNMAVAKGMSMIDAVSLSSGDHQAENSQILLEHLNRFVSEGYVLENVASEFLSSGEPRQYKSSFHGLVSEGFLTGVVTLYRDEKVQRLQEELVSSLAKSLAADSDDTFFINLVYRLAKTLELDFSAVAELVPGSDGMVKMLAFYDRRRKQYESLATDFCLKGTPGYDVLSGEVKVYQNNVTEKFPSDSYLKNLNIASYIAVPIFGSNDQQLGLISLMHSGPLHNIELAQSVLSIFAIRASAEIERRRSQKEKNIHLQQQKLFIDNNSSGMFVVEMTPPMPTNLSLQKQVQWLADNSRFVECNDALVKLLAYDSRESVLGRSLYGGHVLYDFATQAREFVTGNYSLRDQEVRFEAKDGQEIWLSINLSSVIDDGKLTQVLGIVSDVSERARHARDMEYRANHDGLTGLPNRSFFIEQAERILETSTANTKHALFMLDLDGFKEVNDTLGHDTGDELLKQIGPRLQAHLVDTKALLARLGGDEFAVLIEDYATLEDVTALADELMEAVKSPFTINELELLVGGSVGIALYPFNSDSVSSLMRCADIAMYQAKQESSDYCIYSTDRDHYTVRRLSLMMDVRQAIANDEMRLFYQPIIDLKTEQVIGFEALIRWQHPEHGMLPPGEFIPLIELTDMIIPVTWWVVETAVKQASVWQCEGLDYCVSVNVSARNLIDAGFVDFVKTCLDRYQLASGSLEVEITESTLMSDPDKARQILQELSALGVLISIDDYGTGYSSLAYLKSLPINTLKIDRTFISQMLVNPHDQIIVNSTIQLAHNLGLRVTAEGIEDPSLVAKLYGLGCDKGQGFFICKPIPVEELHVWLSLHNRRVIN